MDYIILLGHASDSDKNQVYMCDEEHDIEIIKKVCKYLGCIKRCVMSPMMDDSIDCYFEDIIIGVNNAYTDNLIHYFKKNLETFDVYKSDIHKYKADWVEIIGEMTKWGKTRSWYL